MGKEKLKLFDDWKVHLLCLALVLCAEFIGRVPINFGKISINLFPMLFALVIGIVLSFIKSNGKPLIINQKDMETAGPYIGISVMFLCAKMGADIGPYLGKLFESSWALLLQELGNLGTIFFSLPVAVLVFKMGRAAVGCCFSISREGSLAIVSDLYGLDSPEGKGVMGGYITGTLLGTVFNGVMVSILISLNIFHPYALAMACGTGSASMMAAALAPLLDAYPHMVSELSSYATASQVLTNLDGLYMSLFIALPLTNWLYKVLKGKKAEEPSKEGVSN
jgi:Protein of unknown function (DUF3100).